MAGGHGTDRLPGDYHGWWGSMSTLKQKGVTSYSLSPNRQRPLAGTLNAAVFNTFRRTRGQILFWSVPLIIGYSTMQWAIERNEFLNSKEGRALYADSEE